jgi:hypothetical protein
MKLASSFLLTFLLAVFSDALGQSDIKYWTISEQSGFPLFACADLAAAKRVNIFIQTQLLHKLIDANTIDPFDKLQNSTFENYEVLRNDSLILSLVFSFEGCGAYCEYYDQHLTFDSFSGNPITTQHLFRPEAWMNIKQSVSDLRNNALSEYISYLKKQLAGVKLSGDDTITWRQQLEMYDECLQSRDTGSVNAHRFYMGNNSVTFVEERCSNHAMRALDDLDQFHTQYVISDTSQLSRYGKYVFRFSTEYVAPPESFTIFSGTIAGKYPIWFFVSDANGFRSYSYCYKKYGTVIMLQATHDHPQLILTELTDEGDELGKFYLRETQEGLSGSYLSRSGMEMKMSVSKVY